MNTTSKALAAAIVGLSITGAGSALAASHAEKMENKMEQCYGVAKAGKNDCKTKTSSCVGTSKIDAADDAFIAVPAGTCDKISGGFTKAS